MTELGNSIPQFILRSSVVLSLLGSSVVWNALFPLPDRKSNWLGYITIGFGQIVLSCTVLSELHALSLTGFAVFNLLSFGAAVIALRLTGADIDLRRLYFPNLVPITSWTKQYWLHVVFAIILFAIIGLGVLPYTFTPGDAARYHIPRAHYWLQNETAQHFFTDNYRQVEFPPNTSFIYLWQIAVFGSYSKLNIAQFIAGLLTAFVVTALSITIGHQVHSSILAGLTFLSMPGVILQMSTPLNDLLTASFGALLIYFAMRGFLVSLLGTNIRGNNHYMYAGIAFGLFLGAKLTALFLLPSLAVICSFLILRNREAVRPLLALGFACGIGFLVFGSYNYFLNILDFGHPIASSNALESSYVHHQVALHGDVIPGALDPVANFIRYTYQIMDWIIVNEIPGADTLYHLHNSVYRGISELLGLDLDTVGIFDLRDFGMRQVSPSSVGFGAPGYLILVSSILMLPITLWRSCEERQFALSGALLWLGLGWLVVFSSTIAWTPGKVRYFSIVFAFLVPAVLPYLGNLGNPKTRGLLILAPLMAICLWSAGKTALVNQQYASNEHALSTWQQDIIERTVPPTANIGVAGPVEFMHILRVFPNFSFSPVKRNHIPQILRSRSVDAVLVHDPDGDFQRFHLPVEYEQSLLVLEPRDHMLANKDLMGIEIFDTSSGQEVQLSDSGLVRRRGYDHLEVLIPTLKPVSSDAEVQLLLVFPTSVPSDEAISLSCQGKRIEFQSEGSRLVASIPPGTFDLNLPYQDCDFAIFDHQFGMDIPSDQIKVSIYRAPALPGPSSNRTSKRLP